MLTLAKRAQAPPAQPESDQGGMNLPFDPITLTFSELHYYVPNPAGAGELELLKGIFGVFKPGVLTALMGASGAGAPLLCSIALCSCVSLKAWVC